MTNGDNTEPGRLLLGYRGEITGMVGDDATIKFVTRHEEGIATGVYRIDVDGGAMSLDPLPAPANHLAQDATHVYAACTDRIVYRGAGTGGPLQAFAGPLDEEPTFTVSTKEHVIILGNRTVFVSSRSGELLQNLELGERGTAIAVDETGQWLVVGDQSGMLHVFSREEKGASRPDFAATGSAQVHDGAVTCILFEHGESRVLSSGADLRIQATYVRGKPESEDRGGGNNHEKPVRVLTPGPLGRFYSAGDDKVVKAWPAGANRKRPSSSDAVNSPVRVMAVCKRNAKAALALGCEDGGIRLLALDEEGRTGDLLLTIQDVYARSRKELKRKEVDKREAALREVAALADGPALKITAKASNKDDDHGLRLLAAELLGAWPDRRAVPILDELIEARNDDIRLAAFHGLRRHEGQESLRPMELALVKGGKKGKGVLGIAAVHALGEWATRNDQAMTRLIRALDEEHAPVRLEALRVLEKLFNGDEDPRAQVLALKSGHEDIRLESLARLYERKLLELPEVMRLVRRHGEDPNADVRRRAFQVSVLARPLLARMLRSRDEELHRALHELENRTPPGAAQSMAGEAGPVPEKPAETPGEADLRPLLEAMSSRSSDTALQGAGALANLGDERALGALLQLSREESEDIRVAVCGSLNKLRDERALGRLRMLLFDDSARVRDAAFTALRELETESAAIEAALNTPDENVRRRGLKDLFVLLRRDTELDFQGDVPFLERALNDPSLSVAREAFKGALDLGQVEPRLRFLRRSVHTEIRRDVLTELRARMDEDWVKGAILDFFQDQDGALRRDALKLLTERFKNDLSGILTEAMNCPHGDVREQAARLVAARPGPDVSDLVRKGLEDKKPEIRGLMVDALIRHEDREQLEWAMTSEHRDVRLRAASARALYGDSAALKPLLETITRVKPERGNEEQELWKTEVLGGLSGLRDLASADAFDATASLLTSEDADIRREAARALAFICEPGRVEDLRRFLSRAKKKNQRDIALALAYAGDSTGASLIFEQKDAMGISAALCLGGDKQELLLSYLDHSDEMLREKALLLLLFMENAERNARPRRCMAALSSAFPRTRLLGARAVENFANEKQFREFVLEVVRDRGDKLTAWKIDDEKLMRLGRVLAFGKTRPRVFAFTGVLESLVELKAEKKDEGEKLFEHRLGILESRFADEIAAMDREASARTPAKPEYTGDELNRLALGAYAGLSRVGGAAAEARVRKTALAALREMARRDTSLLDQITAIFLPAFQDSQEFVREQVFNDLIELGVDQRLIASEALESGQGDLGRRGLELLGRDLRDSTTVQVLERVFREFEDGLEAEAARILSGPRGEQAILRAGLDVRSAAQRKRSLAGLNEVLTPDSGASQEVQDSARGALRDALQSRYRDVALGAVARLAALKDEFAFDALAKLVAGDDASEQEGAIQGLRALGDPRSTEVLLGRIGNDPAGTAQTKELFHAVGEFRMESAAGALAEHIRAGKHEGEAFDALLKVSGYDQPNPPEPETEGGIARKVEREPEPFPRHDHVLAVLMKEVYQTGNEGRMKKLIKRARFASSDLVDPMLAVMTRHPAEGPRLAALEVVGKRLRTVESGREARRDALVSGLEHADGESRFIAAEGLAAAGFKDGLNILLTGVDLLPEFDKRRRALIAMGRLADPRCLDTLLRFVDDSEHALHETAVEAIGHMHASEKADEIQDILIRLARGGEYIALAAMAGLRWFNSRAGWETILGRARDEEYYVRNRVAELLRYHDDQVAVQVLSRMIREDGNYQVTRTAVDSIRGIFGEESLEPLYIALECPDFSDLSFAKQEFERLRNEADAARVLHLLPRVHDEEYRESAATFLLTREPLPVREAADSLEAPEYETIAAAAWILGRAGSVEDQVKDRMIRTAERIWREMSTPGDDAHASTASSASRKETALLRLLWALGRLRTGFSFMLSIVMDGESPRKTVRLAAAKALATRASQGDVQVPVGIGTEPDPDLRRALLAVAARVAPDDIGRVITEVSDDGPALNPVLTGGDNDVVLEFLREGAANVHNQGVLLPHLIQQRDVQGLNKLLADTALTRDARMGVVEAMAATSTDAARESLREFAGRTDDVELRMAAWRSLRRAERRDKSGAGRYES